MAKWKIRSILITFATVCGILGISGVLIAFGRGYRIDVLNNRVKTTGLISATSDPVGAQVYIDTRRETATNNSFAIDPAWYTVEISKEGYIPWEKKLRVQGEVVTRADAFLFPTSPSLSALTTTGVHNPVLSPDGTKIAYTTSTSNEKTNQATAKKAGLWVYELAERPLGRNRDPKHVGTSDTVFNFSASQIYWSPDSTQIMATIGTSIRLYDVDKLDMYQNISLTYETYLDEWEQQREVKEHQKLEAFKKPIIDIASSSARIISFSPDETKILYEATASAELARSIDPPLIGTNSTEESRRIEPGKLYVYDSREDRNYFLLDKTELLPTTPSPVPTQKPTMPLSLFSPPTTYNPDPLPIHWFPTSRHLLITLEGKIDVVEYDRTNWITVYSGPFQDGFIAPWPNG
ncbi:MAG: PEGA domain-containing protein, partial [bacterium]|nr:PEGA domain-containing protein [bacterium]